MYLPQHLGCTYETWLHLLSIYASTNMSITKPPKADGETADSQKSKPRCACMRSFCFLSKRLRGMSVDVPTYVSLLLRPWKPKSFSFFSCLFALSVFFPDAIFLSVPLYLGLLIIFSPEFHPTANDRWSLVPVLVGSSNESRTV